jgi:cellulose synthase/poly-beta-1,6-N-acetylglucosamine synthase-like glycosyltransferase
LFLTIVFFLLFSLLSVPILFLFAEVVAAIITRPSEENPWSNEPRPPTAVLIPAHNEEKGISSTIEAIKEQVSESDRIIVVADNCSDQTAEVARCQGTEVVLRQNSGKVGKGHALDFGLQFLKKNPPVVVAMFDADITISHGTLDRIIRKAHTFKKPIQAKYILKSPDDGGARKRISAFAFLFKNFIRPLGLSRLGGGCLLTGTGMAFPWEVIKNAPLASSNIVEDMQLGIDLSIAGAPPVFCPDSLVKGDLAPDITAASAQRTRWEHGHILTLYNQAGRLFHQAIIQRRLDLALLGLEVAVPPLASLVILLGCNFIVALVLYLFELIPISILTGFTALVVLLLISVVTGWWFFGRTMLTFHHILSIPFYILWKIPIYVRFLFKPQKEWVRTERKSGTGEKTNIGE